MTCSLPVGCRGTAVCASIGFSLQARPPRPRREKAKENHMSRALRLYRLYAPQRLY
jgi:hypothetical protein